MRGPTVFTLAGVGLGLAAWLYPQAIVLWVLLGFALGGVIAGIGL